MQVKIFVTGNKLHTENDINDWLKEQPREIVDREVILGSSGRILVFVFFWRELEA